MKGRWERERERINEECYTIGEVMDGCNMQQVDEDDSRMLSRPSDGGGIDLRDHLCAN